MVYRSHYKSKTDWKMCLEYLRLKQVRHRFSLPGAIITCLVLYIIFQHFGGSRNEQETDVLMRHRKSRVSVTEREPRDQAANVAKRRHEPVQLLPSEYQASPRHHIGDKQGVDADWDSADAPEKGLIITEGNAQGNQRSVARKRINDDGETVPRRNDVNNHMRADDQQARRQAQQMDTHDVHQLKQMYEARNSK